MRRVRRIQWSCRKRLSLASESRSRIEKKRKQDGTGQPAKKRKRFENIMNWGDGEDEDAKDYVPDQGIRHWLMQDDRSRNDEKEDNSQSLTAPSSFILQVISDFV